MKTTNTQMYTLQFTKEATFTAKECEKSYTFIYIHLFLIEARAQKLHFMRLGMIIQKVAIYQANQILK